MSKRIVVSLMIVMLVFGGVFKVADAQALSASQIVELLITWGTISPDNAAAARAAATSATVPTTAPTTAPATGVTGSSVSVQTAVTASNLYHSADTNRDWKISNEELTRFIVLYDYRVSVPAESGNRRTGEYHISAGTVDGLPVGLQIIGPHFSEQVLLELAHVLERERPWPLTAPSAPI